MAILPIIEKGNAVLNKSAAEVKIEDIQTPKIQKIIYDMQETLAAISDGVGLAAPQVNVSLQIFIVSKRILTKKDKTLDKDIVCINPKIVKFSKTKKWLDGEGCLSVRWWPPAPGAGSGSGWPAVPTPTAGRPGRAARQPSAGAGVAGGW